MERARNYCFTLNNYSDKERTSVAATECKYLVFGKKVSESETPHLQGFISFKNAKSFKAVKKILPRAHIETAITIDEAITLQK